jgi:hypothetical protein
MDISERDIFNFVFYPEKLSVEKVEHLKTSKLFDEEIDFYRLLRNSMEEELSEDVKLKLAEKIPLYVPMKIFVLFPVKETVKKRKNDVPIFAAASPNEKPAVAAKTFMDENNHYLIRLLNFKDSSKIYVFSTTDEILKNYKVVVKPSGQTFGQIDNSSPIEISTPIEAESIELQFN